MSQSEQIDDIFDDDADDTLLGEKEWQSLRKDRVLDGYRDGLMEGKECLVENGFSAGYTEAMDMVYQTADLRGALCALISFAMLQGENNENPENKGTGKELEAEALLVEVTELEKEIKESLKTFNSYKSTGTDNEELESHTALGENVVDRTCEMKSKSGDCECDSSCRNKPLSLEETEKNLTSHSSSAGDHHKNHSDLYKDQDCRNYKGKHEEDKLKDVLDSVVSDSDSISSFTARICRLKEAFDNLIAK